MSTVSAIIACLCGSPDDTYPVDQKVDTRLSIVTSPGSTDTDVADEVVYLLRNAERNGPELKTQVCDVISAEGWTEKIARAVLDGLEYIIKNWREKVGNALREAIDAAEAAAKACFTFTEEHPYLTAGLLTIVAVGVLVWMAPWAVEALGFGELGPIAGMPSSEGPDVDKTCVSVLTESDTFAAAWQRTYAGFVPKGSLFSFFQRLGMTWK